VKDSRAEGKSEPPGTERLYEQSSELDMGDWAKDAFMKRGIARLKVELIVLFGYSAGILLQAGFNPLGGFFSAWENFIQAAIPDPYIRATFAIFLLLLLGLSVRKAYAIGGPAAIIAVAMGFLAGLATPTDQIIGPGMLLLAALSAYVSVQGWRTLKGPPG
jgi:hypothetical protein